MNDTRRFCPVALTVIVLAVLVGCGGRVTNTPPVPKPEPVASTPAPVTETLDKPLKGVSLSPRSFQPADFNTFLVESRKAGEIISWAGDWAELGKPQSGPFVVAGLPRGSAYVPIVELQFFTQATGKLLRPLNAENEAAYINRAAGFVSQYQPRYLGIGIEVNILYEKAPADFDAFVSFFARACDAVKKASPNTQVFTVFQLEKMKGLSGGLFGGSNDPGHNQWSLLERFPKADFFAFTTYPGLVFKTPGEMSADYYTEIKTHTTKPVAFTEIGWQSASVAADWPGSEATQTDFIRRFFDMTRRLEPEFDIWSFLYDQTTVAPFNSMGLFRPDGTPKTGWEAWISGA